MLADAGLGINRYGLGTGQVDDVLDQKVHKHPVRSPICWDSTSAPDGGTKTVLLLHVPSALIVNLPDRTFNSTPSWDTLAGMDLPSPDTSVYSPVGSTPPGETGCFEHAGMASPAARTKPNNSPAVRKLLFSLPPLSWMGNRSDTGSPANVWGERLACPKARGGSAR